MGTLHRKCPRPKMSRRQCQLHRKETCVMVMVTRARFQQVSHPSNQNKIHLLLESLPRKQDPLSTGIPAQETITNTVQKRHTLSGRVLAS
ncbi:hypothetical protein DUNSADRAFT_10164 [Dunaliella salina]|uniref:Encoded protein n=1 Tax=Dunaliella salina TaxID=3046 RepID=A0ABQ7GFZ2_DUNSA|nr:hypothetical protein DUNSADRAFT_10164 [Dunaliella salina]|eukprot:KAF5833513.1 hypothetical protein DUNSADRAFT_10164 [Dunaliella salina]